METMLSIDQFAAQHGVTTRTVRRWLDDERIAGAVKVGNRWSLPADAVVAERPAGEIVTAGHVTDMSTRGGVTVARVIEQLPVMLPLDVAARVLGVTEYALRRHAEYFQLQRLGARGSYVMPKARVRELDGRA